VHHINDPGDKYKTLIGKPEKAPSETRKWKEKIKTVVKVTMGRLIVLRWLLRSSSWLVFGCRLKKNVVPSS
jgi:hypothetical protein